LPHAYDAYHNVYDWRQHQDSILSSNTDPQLIKVRLE
jgi:hypothetical protein